MLKPPFIKFMVYFLFSKPNSVRVFAVFHFPNTTSRQQIICLLQTSLCFLNPFIGVSSETNFSKMTNIYQSEEDHVKTTA